MTFLNLLGENTPFLYLTISIHVHIAKHQPSEDDDSDIVPY